MSRDLAMSDRLTARAEWEDAAAYDYHRESGDDSFAQSSARSSGRGPYVTRQRLATLAAGLTERDRKILSTLQRLHVVTGGQLARLHCVDYAGPSADRQCRRALASLVERGLIMRLGRRIGGVRAGSAGWCYSLGIAGQRLLAGTHRPRRPWTPGLAFLAHDLGVSEIYTRLREAERQGLLKLVEFAAEPECWRRYPGLAGQVTLKPDAFVVTHVGPFQDHWMLEVDRATESATTLDRKLDAHRAYWQSGTEAAATGAHPRVLWLVPSQRRQEVLVAACARQPAEAWPLFQVALFGAVIEVMTAGA